MIMNLNQTHRTSGQLQAGLEENKETHQQWTSGQLLIGYKEYKEMHQQELGASYKQAWNSI